VKRRAPAAPPADIQAGSHAERIEAAVSWCRQRGWQPFPFQREAWRAIGEGESGLLHAPTGTGKTLAVWLGAIATGWGAGPLRVVWLTPLRALAADTASALAEPLASLAPDWTVATRTGDTSTAVRRALRTCPPTAMITTPESLSLLLSFEDAAEAFSGLRLVVVDEWHELLSTKRGVQAELALARLRSLAPGLLTWGISATLGNIDEAAKALVGSAGRPHVVRAEVPRRLEIETLIPDPMERFPWAGHMGMRLLPQVLTSLEKASTSLVFTNTRSQAERWFESIQRARPEWKVALHHGSIDRELRAAAEDGLRRGKLKAVVATGSLDLGVDFGPVEQVLQIGSPKGIARLLQRAGRSGHRPGAVGKLICVPTHALELVECAAARQAASAGASEPRRPLTAALDVLAQHIVTVACSGGFREEELFNEVRGTAAFADLDRSSWQWAMDFAARGGPALVAYPDFARIRERFGRWYVAGPAIARRHRMAIGTITSDAAVEVKWLRGGRLGTVEESFISRLNEGDRFLFAGRTLRLFRFDGLTAWVRRAKPSAAGVAVPRWNGGRMPLSTLLAAEVQSLVAGGPRKGQLTEELRAVEPLLATQAAWSSRPQQDTLLIELVASRDGHHAFLYPFAGRLVHEGLAALVAWRIAQHTPATLVWTVNDWGFQILGRQRFASTPAARAESFWRRMLSPDLLLEDLLACLNGTEMARRQFREIARVAGLIAGQTPGRKGDRNLQASAGLLFDVLEEHDPGNMLLEQARREVLETQFEYSRLRGALERVAHAEITVVEPSRLSPLAFPLWAEQIQSRLSTQGWLERITEMAKELEETARCSLNREASPSRRR
jgi:ATP-dependent Lhr-like helicase